VSSLFRFKKQRTNWFHIFPHTPAMVEPIIAHLENAQLESGFCSAERRDDGLRALGTQ
jgi:hypothetical protein